MIEDKYMTLDFAYQIGRNLVNRHWPKDNTDGNVLCEILVRPGEVPTRREVIKAVWDALKSALYMFRIQQKNEKRLEKIHAEDKKRNEPYTGLWICGCGWEGQWEEDNGVCPICHGYGYCPWNG